MKNSSTDLYFVSFAYAKGIQPAEVIGDGRRKVFYFDNPRFDEIAEEYSGRRGNIEPIAYQNALRNIKALIYNQ